MGLYPEFKARYNILGASLVAKAKNDKAAAGAVLDLIKLPAEKFRLGHTKVFFRAGILGVMEEAREHSETTSLLRPGCGCKSGLQLSQTSSALNLENSRKNMKIRLLWLRQTLTVPLRSAQRC